MEPLSESLKQRVGEARLNSTTTHLSEERACKRNAPQAELDILWKRVEEARLQWKSARQYANEFHEDRFSGVMLTADGSQAHLQALHAQGLAVENYHHALKDFNAALTGGPLEPAPADGRDALTPREREVLTLIAMGKSSKQIAAELGIAFRTAVCHRYRLYRKLNVHTSVELARAALRMGLVKL